MQRFSIFIVLFISLVLCLISCTILPENKYKNVQNIQLPFHYSEAYQQSFREENGFKSRCPFSHKSPDKEIISKNIKKPYGNEEDDDYYYYGGPNDPLQEMNLILQKNYQTNKMDLVMGHLETEPLGIIDGDYIYLLPNSSSPMQRYNITPDVFTNLKLVCHVALGTYVLLEPSIENGEFTDDQISEIQSYLSYFSTAKSTLSDRNFSDEQLYRSFEIVQNSQDILNVALNKKRIDKDQLNTWAKNITIKISKHINDAGIAALNLIDTHVQTFKKSMGDRFNTFKVIILGSHMAKHQNMYLQYFSKLLDSGSYSGERIIYAEGVGIDDAISLYGTHLIDFGVGDTFFDDGEHMHNDILAPIASKYVPILLNKDKDK